MSDHILTNANFVLADRIVRGSLVMADGVIQRIDDHQSHASEVDDLDGDYVVPGLVDLHTDNVEKHLTPRPGMPWPAEAAMIAHDAQVASAGITTVFNAVSIGDLAEDSARVQRLSDIVEAVTTMSAADATKSSHFLHLRCEISFPAMEDRLELLSSHDLVRMYSIMDHTPGERQYANLDACYAFYREKYGFDEKRMLSFMADCREKQAKYADRHRRFVVELAGSRRQTLASHDDETVEQVRQAVGDGASISEFPTTLEAARACRPAGLKVMVGGPNLVRGRSHTGNVSAQHVAGEDLVDIVCSDYIPHSALHAAFVLADAITGWDLPRAIRTMTQAPAQCVGLLDRGELAVGKRADLVCVAHREGIPIVRRVWKGGRRVA